MSTPASPDNSMVSDMAQPEDSGDRLIQPWKALFLAVAVGLGGFALWSAGPGIAEDQILLGIYTLATWVLLLLWQPVRKDSPWTSPKLTSVVVALVLCVLAVNALLALDRIERDGVATQDVITWIVMGSLAIAATRMPRAIDLVLIGLAAGVLGFYMIDYLALVDRAGAWGPTDTGMSLVAVLIALEVARRGIGPWIPGIALVMILYAYFGDLLPHEIGHRGVNLPRIVNYAFYSQEGIFGVMTTVMANTVLVFILLGAFMHASGMGRFFIDFPLAIAGRTAGGPAKVAIFASAVFGSISGSSLANIVSTGTFTIPLMKRVGFRKEVAGAVENTASLGGQLLPPVMGAGVFVMAEITGAPYVDIIAIAAIPALLYLASIATIVHFQAKREGIRPLDRDEVPGAWAVFRAGWFHLVPFAVLLAFLISGHSPDWCAVMAIVCIVAINWGRHALARIDGTPPPDEFLGVRGILGALAKGVENSLIVGAAAAAIGVIVGMVALTGLGLKTSYILVDFSNGQLLIAMVLIALTSLIMGMALPITASYLVLVILAGPALEQFGIPLIAAHLIVFWLSQDSNITPPVCLGAYVAASIAGGDPWRTGWISFRFAKMLYVMPLLFAFTPILFHGPLVWTLWTIATATVGTVAFAAWTAGFLRAELSRTLWLVLLAATVLCFLPHDVRLAGPLPGYALNIAGIALFAALCLFQRPAERVRQHPAGGVS